MALPEWTEDGRRVLVVSKEARDLRLELRDGRTLAPLLNYRWTAGQLSYAPPVVAFSDRVVFCGTRDGFLLAYAIQNGELLLRLRVGTTPIRRIRINSPETKLLVVLEQRLLVVNLPREMRSAAEITRWIADKAAR
jgi:hypothetical protein